MRIVLVTGPRARHDREAVWTALHEQWALSDDGKMMIIHGAAKSGADADAEAFYRKYWRQGVVVMRVPVTPEEWERYGRFRAGRRRNARMVRIPNIDAVLSFAGDFKARGTRNCIALAEAASLEVIKR